MLNEEVRKIMTKDLNTVTADVTLEEVGKIMIKNKLNLVPVVENGKLIGMVGTHDLWRNSMNPKSNATTVGDIMSTNIIKIAPKDKVGTAAELFMDKRFKTLPVVNLDNDLKGVVTAFDVMRHTLRKEYKTPILYQEVIESRV